LNGPVIYKDERTIAGEKQSYREMVQGGDRGMVEGKALDK